MLSLALCSFLLIGGHYTIAPEDGWQTEMRELFPHRSISYETEAEFKMRHNIERLCAGHALRVQKRCIEINSVFVDGHTYVDEIVLRRPLTRRELSELQLC